MSEKRGIVIFARNSPITGHMQMGVIYHNQAHDSLSPLDTYA